MATSEEIREAFRREDDVGPCDQCGHVEPRKEFEGRALCYDHWHGARETKTPWRVRRVERPGVPKFVTSGVYLEHEARKVAAQFTAEHPDDPFEAVPCDHWSGERIAHPGYLKRRVAAVRAELSDADFKKWCAAMGDSIKYWV